ncbi:tail fiber protein [Vibrio phage VPp1]|nr:tail fiber protein [Vibrio phage VPp1]
MAIDNGNYIAGMNINIPAPTDPRYEGADQIKAVKRMVQESFPNIDGEVTATVSELNKMTDGTQGRFIGETTMFQGLIEDIPVGWVLSDGTIQNGFQTIDLRDKFIMGYNNLKNTAQPNRSTGGENNPDLSAHLVSEEHTLILAEIPAHKHPLEYNATGSGGGGTGPDVKGGSGAETEEVGGGKPHKHGLTAKVDNGGVPTFDNRPEYVVLAFIVYVGRAA